MTQDEKASAKRMMKIFDNAFALNDLKRFLNDRECPYSAELKAYFWGMIQKREKELNLA